ncbi:hypothetical protein KPL78_14940 [Roseomonas sp. HJA6]|uniref:Uncharacterized protein n=1 Tax=Roseomonas alba TaxID=2846776 RepID=A0ABS7AA60_9PROT|nr:hypothetical protein [Neoroseomonas alba]MBW6399156.1 hypothetical protein [Neoroseomonas alba]
MDDKDRVFARFQENKPASPERRETLTIPRRAGAPGSRVVEVVHLRPSAAPAGKDRPRRVDLQVRAASWDDGFPAKSAAPLPLPTPVEAAPVEAAKPAMHVMPMWEPMPAEAVATAPPPAVETVTAGAKRPRGAGGPKAPKPTRHVADPFDDNDNGANCMRCGYAIEPVREARGLMTCAACG